MTGHQPIIAMRRAGLKPPYVWISDFDHVPLDGRTVIVAGDTPELLDFRFLIGVTAIVEGRDAARVDRIAAAIQPIAARVVASTFDQAPYYPKVTRVTDTQGVMTWPT